MTPRRLLAPVIAATVAVTGIIAIPTGAASAATKYKACANKKTGEMRLVVKGKKCKKNEKKLKWNVKAMNVAPEHEHLQRRNLYACKGFNRLCEFHALCSGADTEENGYRPREAIADDRKVEGISPSRLGTFLRCPREYHYRYTKKIERIHRKYDDSLTVGSLVHAGLEMVMMSKMAADAEEWRASFDWLGEKGEA